MHGAYNGKFLHVDLDRGMTAVEEVPTLTYRMYLGGPPWRRTCSTGR